MRVSEAERCEARRKHAGAVVLARYKTAVVYLT